ncbi:hypothetical protein PUR59_18240 [Streptomyces sp. SP18ES09]|nr:hypothetical protein [Streptomyces sp. SP18ES09]MEE1816946.1 hypothetical protein [Streptomyces sp. SP18ES09]
MTPVFPQPVVSAASYGDPMTVIEYVRGDATAPRGKVYDFGG